MLEWILFIIIGLVVVIGGIIYIAMLLKHSLEIKSAEIEMKKKKTKKDVASEIAILAKQINLYSKNNKENALSKQEILDIVSKELDD